MSSEHDKALTQESLMDEYGLDSETAERLSKDLPNFLKTDDDGSPAPAAKDPLQEPPAPAPIPETTAPEAPVAGTPPEPPAPADQEEEKADPTAEWIERMKASLKSAGVSEEVIRKTLESLTDEADVMEPISVDKPLYDKLKRKMKKEGIKMSIISSIVSVKEPETADAGGLKPGRVKGEPISVDKEFMKKLKQIMKASGLPKDMQILVMEPINVDTIDSCDTVMDSLNFTLAEDSLTFGDGILKGHATCAAAMVQDYSGVKVLKCPDELKLAVDFARMLPITDQHPPSALVRDQKEIKGWTGLLSWNADSRSIECDFEIFDSALIDKVRSGKRDVSIGFTCEIERKEGKYVRDNKEETFDAVQRNIVLNHLAAGIEKGRCPAPICGIKSDAAPPGETLPGGPTPSEMPGKGDPTPINEETKQKALLHYNLTEEQWVKLTEAERQRLVEEMPKDAAPPGPVILPIGPTPSEPGRSDPAGSIPRGVALRAMKFHNLTEEQWVKLTETERLKLVEQMEEKYPTAYPIGNGDRSAEAEVIKQAQEVMALEKAKTIDSIMDSKPMKPRSYFEDMNLIVLKDMKALLDSKQEGARLSFSDSSKPGDQAINDAYTRIHRKSP